MLSTRINARLSGPLAVFVERMVSKTGLYETPSEYVRDLIRRDMEVRENRLDRESILTGYRDIASDAVMASSGDFKKDMKSLAKKEKSNWQ
ncbi:MAG: CopG family transcriptional regulator [Alphaproteobacteria bacterium]|nr:CopG family transcriptional regulator [Alphaproteobacteria bacterium]